MAHNAIHLGIELEFIIFGKNVTRNWNETAEKMAQTLTAAGVETEVREIMEGIPPRWVITTDASISKVKFANHPAGIRPDEHGIELVSCCFAETSDWQAEIALVFDTLSDEGYTLRVNMCCGMHVHSSHGPEKNWTFGTARSLAALFLEHEAELTKISGGLARELNEHCKSNRSSKHLSQFDDSTEHAVAAVRQSPRTTSLVDTMCVNTDGELTRYWKLNLFRLVDPEVKCSPSIEFRQHEGVHTSEPVVRWINEVINLMNLSTGEGQHQMQESLEEEKAGDEEKAEEKEHKEEDKPEKGIKHDEAANRELLAEMAGCGGDDEAEEGSGEDEQEEGRGSEQEEEIQLGTGRKGMEQGVKEEAGENPEKAEVAGGGVAGGREEVDGEREDVEGEREEEGGVGR